MRTFYILFFFGCFVSGFSQQTQDTILLENVLVSTRILNEYSTGQTIRSIKDSTLHKQPSNPTTFFLFNSPIHFKENGFGMVSSPSFRGTLASHTLVVWNGIAINSQLNGQVDFNAFNLLGYDEVMLRPGGGSLLYGSGGIGGTVHLNQNLAKDKGFKGQLLTSIGSFNTYRSLAKVQGSDGKLSYNISLGHNYSDNDYEIESTNSRNLNGKYQNVNLNYGIAYQLNKKNSIELFGEFYDGDRYLSITRTSENKGKYLDKNFKSLAVWQYKSEKIRHYFRGAFLREHYRYYQNRYTDTYSFGTSNSFLASYESEISLPNSIELKPLLSIRNVVGEGSDIENPSIFNVTSALEFKQILNLFKYEIGLRYERHSMYKDQFLGEVGLEYRTTEFHKIKVHFSKNFRAPTLNDLYWKDAGNVELKPENSYQAELTNEFKLEYLNISLTAFYNNIKDLIQWRPMASGLWSPVNIGRAETYGLELNAGYKRKFGDVLLHFNETASFINSKDLETKHFLIYSPKLISNTQLGLAYKRFNANLQFHYTGEVFTTTSNSNTLNSFWLTNFSSEYRFGKNRNIGLGWNIYNLFDESYQTTEYRPMPGRYYQLALNLKF